MEVLGVFVIRAQCVHVRKLVTITQYITAQHSEMNITYLYVSSKILAFLDI